jgi:hypothetical protein
MWVTKAAVAVLCQSWGGIPRTRRTDFIARKELGHRNSKYARWFLGRACLFGKDGSRSSEQTCISNCRRAPTAEQHSF